MGYRRVAKAARMSGQQDMIDDEEFEELLRSKSSGVADGDKKQANGDANSSLEEIGLTKKVELWVTDMILKMGFIGIVACASVR